MDYEFELADVHSDEARKVILAGIVEYNRGQTGISDHRPLAVVLRSPNGEVVGGLLGRTGYSWLFVEILFLPQSARRQGIGAKILDKAEAEARARGCRGVWLDTFEFHARPFYERLGYECFGVLDDYPAGSARYFMKKTL